MPPAGGCRLARRSLLARSATPIRRVRRSLFDAVRQQAGLRAAAQVKIGLAWPAQRRARRGDRRIASHDRRSRRALAPRGSGGSDCRRLPLVLRAAPPLSRGPGRSPPRAACRVPAARRTRGAPGAVDGAVRLALETLNSLSALTSCTRLRQRNWLDDARARLQLAGRRARAARAVERADVWSGLEIAFHRRAHRNGWTRGTTRRSSAAQSRAGAAPVGRLKGEPCGSTRRRRMRRATSTALYNIGAHYVALGHRRRRGRASSEGRTRTGALRALPRLPGRAARAGDARACASPRACSGEQLLLSLLQRRDAPDRFDRFVVKRRGASAHLTWTGCLAPW